MQTANETSGKRQGREHDTSNYISGSSQPFRRASLPPARGLIDFPIMCSSVCRFINYSPVCKAEAALWLGLMLLFSHGPFLPQR